VCYCFKFLDHEDCDSFKAALHVTLTQAAQGHMHQQLREGGDLMQQQLLHQSTQEKAPCTTTSAAFIPPLTGGQPAPANPADIKALIKVSPANGGSGYVQALTVV
jgi:hypothetical protein